MKVDNAVIEIMQETCMGEFGPAWVDFCVLPRPTTLELALKGLRMAMRNFPKDELRLIVEDWDTGASEIIRVVNVTDTLYEVIMD